MRDVDIVVVGGGAMGSAAAWRLADRGVEVVMLERFAAGHVRGASHGASRIFRLAYAESVYVELAKRALVLWRELEERSGTPLLTTTDGLDHGDPGHLEALADAAAKAGVPTTWLEPGEAARRWPGMRFDGRVLFQPDAGRVHADDTVTALRRLSGAEIHYETPVTGIAVRGDRVEVNTGDESYRARVAVVTVGAWTAKLLPIALPKLTVTQEQPAHFAPADDAEWPSFIHHGPLEIYGLRTPGEGIKVGVHGNGPVVDPDHRDYLPEPGRLRELREYVRDWLPGLDPDTFETISCTYTTTPTHDLILDRVGPLVVGAGFSGHGFKFVPAIGEVLADLALGTGRADRTFALGRQSSKAPSTRS